MPRSKRVYSIVEIHYNDPVDASGQPVIASVNVEENVTAEELPELLAANDGVKRFVFQGSMLTYEVKQVVQLGGVKTRKPREKKTDAPPKTKKHANGAKAPKETDKEEVTQ